MHAVVMPCWACYAVHLDLAVGHAVLAVVMLGVLCSVTTLGIVS